MLKENLAKPENKLNGKNQIIYSVYGNVNCVCEYFPQVLIFYTKQDEGYLITSKGKDGISKLETTCSNNQLPREIRKIFDAGTKKAVGKLRLTIKKIRSFVDIIKQPNA